MDIDHFILEHRKTLIGDVLTLGRAFVSDTAHPALLDLDGISFASQAAVAARLGDAAVSLHTA